MASRDDTSRHNQYIGSHESNKLNRVLPILNLPEPHSSASPPSDPMEITSPSQKMGPPSRSSPEVSEATGAREGSGDTGGSTSLNAAVAAQAGSGQAPKVVQTAFIHKLYK